MVYAALIYVTATVSVISLWEFDLGRPGGPIGFVLGNWFLWLMLSLLVLLPFGPASGSATVGGPARRESAAPSRSP